MSVKDLPFMKMSIVVTLDTENSLALSSLPTITLDRVLS